MEFLLIIVVALLSIIILGLVFKINIKKAKEIAENKELNDLTQKYPDNIAICKYLLTKLKNSTVKVKEDKNAKNCLYVVVSNKILIADTKESFTRIQTIAHECLHSIQSKSILIFNYVFSNVYLLYFFIIVILGLFGLIQNKMLFLNIFIIMGMIYYFVRSYLENDAMIKARFLAKEYMEEINFSSKAEIEKIVSGFDQINNLGIKGVNYSLFMGILIKVIIISLIFYIF